MVLRRLSHGRLPLFSECHPLMDVYAAIGSLAITSALCTHSRHVDFPLTYYVLGISWTCLLAPDIPGRKERFYAVVVMPAYRCPPLQSRA